jgi:hypothetical protein
MSELAVLDSLGFHARAGTQFRQYEINSLGFRGPELDLASFKGTLIVASGASETFGLYERNGGEWPRQLEDSLAGCTPPVRVLNSAFAGMSLPTVEQDFVRRLAPYQPTMVLYYPTPMQYLYGEKPKAAAPSETPPSSLPAWRSRALPRFRDAFKRATPQPIIQLFRRFETQQARGAYGIVAKQTVEQERLTGFEEDLRGLIGTYRRNGVIPVLVVHRHRFTEFESDDARIWLEAWERFYPAYTGRALAEYDNAAAERVKAIGQDSNVVVVDPLPALRAIGHGAFADYSHLTDAGSAAVAGTAAAAIAPIICRGP